MSTQHTPGPWEIKYEDEEAEYWVTQHHYHAGPAKIIYNIEDARLIAAAPENYACNKELAKIVRELCTAYGHPLPVASLDRSDAAIAKATGNKA